jgi:hypothetical protein
MLPLSVDSFESGLPTIGGFSQPHHVQGRASIADLFPSGKRCGLYILHFANGEIYAGQALDVTRRYVQHAKIHGDIETIYFRRVAKDRLNDEERALIWMLEQNRHRLRNIAFTSIPKGESDFDLIMSVEEQDKWLKDPNFIDSGGSRVVNPELRRKYSRRFEKFAAMPRYGELVDVLRCYIPAGIPAFLRSELSFWCCSCLPSYSNPNVKIYSRVNVGWQEVFTAYEHGNYLYISLHLARSPLEEAFGESLSLLLDRYPTLEVTNHHYEPEGQDQVKLEIRTANLASEVILSNEIVLAVRLFNLRLLKKSACIYSRHHCMDLADRLTRI